VSVYAVLAVAVVLWASDMTYLRLCHLLAYYLELFRLPDAMTYQTMRYRLLDFKYSCFIQIANVHFSYLLSNLIVV
jgi:hypothetical protein